MSQVFPVNVALTAVLTDNANNPLMNATVVFSYKLSSATAFTPGGTAVTDSTGTASVTLALMAPDMYDFLATFNGSPTYAASNVQITFDTTARLPQTQLTVQVTPITSSSASISGSLTSSGTPIPGAAISVSVDGAAVGSATTDSTGAYAFQLTNLSPGGHTVTVSFAGSATYSPSQASSSFGYGAFGGLGPVVAGAAVVTLVVAAAFGFVRSRKKR